MDPTQAGGWRVTADDLTRFAIDVFQSVGVSPEAARTTADVLVTTDTWGVHTHGVKAMRGYVRRLRAGGLRAQAAPRVVSEGPAWAIVDGDSGLGMVTSVLAMQTAIAKARACGIGYAGVRNSCHFGAAGYYVALAARQNMLGLAMANDVPSVTAPGAGPDHGQQSAGLRRAHRQRAPLAARHGHQRRGRRQGGGGTRSRPANPGRLGRR